VFRFRYRHGRVALDRRWGPVLYRTGAQRPGTGPGLLGDFLVVQTNFLPAAEPLTVTAVSTHDSDRVFRIKPFGRSTASWIVSKPALDAATGTIVTHDTSAGRMAALHLDPRRGLRVSWRRKLSSLDFSALIGDAHHRQIAIPDLTSRGDTVVWLSERTGCPEPDGCGSSRPTGETPRPNLRHLDKDRPAERSYGGSRPSEKEAAPS
jgi:hypothetical protein